MKHFLFLLTIIALFSFSSNANDRTETNPLKQEQGIIKESSKLTVFPNPVIGNTFQVKATKKIKSVTATNMLGQKASINTDKKSAYHFALTMNNKNTGIYLITVTYSDDSKEVKRIIAK